MDTINETELRQMIEKAVARVLGIAGMPRRLRPFLELLLLQQVRLKQVRSSLLQVG